MVVDTSALIALLLGEPEAERCAQILAANPAFSISSFSVLETSMVLAARKGSAATRELDLLLHRADARVVPLTAELGESARDAWERFGIGQHPAGLNIGDCCSYALSQSLGEPLLFKGNNFDQTDLQSISL
ncbi:MAG: type II toxin-antitoxin system VapC family toxin [Terrimicrobiaceae bacterium]|jgi:ribonuclease VapC